MTRPMIADVAAEVAAKYGLTVEAVRAGKWRLGVVGAARREAMARAYDLGKSNAQVAHYFGCKDHTVTIHARKQFARLQQGEGA